MRDVRGRAWLFGHDLNTDVIHPPAFYSLDPETVRRGLFHGLDPDLQPRLQAGDVLVGGRNFGCGSSRETSIQSLKLNRVGAIVAVDFARIFFRNATNRGLPCLCFREPGDLGRVRAKELLRISFEDWCMETESGEVIAIEPAGAFVRRIWEAGGLLELLGRT